MNRHPMHGLIVGLAILFVSQANGQAVYKCPGPNGTPIYSHEPCLGAKVVDTRPTEGLDKSSGQSRKGADVLRGEQQRGMAKALEQLLGESAEQYEQRHRRAKLTTAARAECGRLDAVLPQREEAARTAAPTEQQSAEFRLLQTRQRYRELRC